jgi:phosphoadenosine phosphosulfate reductase
MKQQVKHIIEQLNGLSLSESLTFLSENFKQIAFSTSLGLEDQVITHHVFSQNLPIRVFTLDTGRMFNESYKVLDSTRERYKKEIEVYFPKHDATEKLMQTKGAFSFYESVENRKECCFIRKVEPLKRALQNTEVWITGLRAEQSENRQSIEIAEWDEGNQLIKIHPLMHWTLDEVKSEIKKHNIPYNILHDKGFVSIGCAPCTRAIREGEDFRAGRWWWEDKSKKECGLHEK